MFDRPSPASVARWSVAVACALVAGCARSDDIVIGRDDPADSGVGSAGRAGRDAVRAGRSGGNALDADIQNREGVTLEVVTVGCAGECFEVIAVARGGYPPYTYRWEDGSTNAERRLCPEASQAFEVGATDRGYDGEEFTRAAETATASVTAQVLACPDAGTADAGTPDPGTRDAGTPDAGPGLDLDWRPLCIPNGSFEDPMGAIPWRYCRPHDPATPLEVVSAGEGVGLPEAADGTRYLRLDTGPEEAVTISVRLCAPVVAGASYYWTQALALAAGSQPATLEFFLSNTECGSDKLLARAYPNATWDRTCSTWSGFEGYGWLTIYMLSGVEPGGTVFLDEFLESSPTCPARTDEP